MKIAGIQQNSGYSPGTENCHSLLSGLDCPARPLAYLFKLRQNIAQCSKHKHCKLYILIYAVPYEILPP